MTKKFYKIAAVILIVIYAVSGVSVFAKSSDEQMPYQSYTYWTDIGTERKSVYNRAMYRTEQQLDYIGIGVAGFNSLMDVNTDKNGNVYILDDKSRIVVMDKKYSLLYEIGEIKSGSDYLNYDGAQSIYIHTDGTVFICDTENKRILHTDRNGNLIDMYELPDSPLIPDDFDFRPLKIVVDSHNYCYVLSEGSYYGALLYDPNKNFVGFYGANDVTTNIAGKLKNMINRIFINNVKKSASERVLPYCFADIVIDSKDFLYTATGKTEQYDRKDQIKKLNPGTGDNILKSRNVIFTDDKINTTEYIEDDLLGDFFYLVHTHCRKHHQVKWYAEQLCISSDALSSRLRKIYGKNASQLIDETLLTDAKLCLLEPRATIQSVSELLCFADQASFCKFFKRCSGISPSEFRKLGLGFSAPQE